MKLKLWLITLLMALSAECGFAQLIPWLKKSEVTCGAERTEAWRPLLQGKRAGLVANPTSRVGKIHLADTLVRSGVKLVRIFAPEHGFRGEEEAGATIANGTDPVTGIPVISLYGNHKKPLPEDLEGLDFMIYDIQDVGVRFYTYLSTLHLVMEACAEAGLPLLVFDRPNPNGFYIDGPILDTAFRTFVGMHPVPVVHGMTDGEYAGMINGEGWLAGGRKCNLTVIPCTGWDHGTEYVLPVKPSPNLPNQTAIYLYPSVCFFEGTTASLGRGTPFPFQVYGHPDMKGSFTFTPVSIPGVSLHPPQENKLCHGRDLRVDGVRELSSNPCLMVEWIIEARRNMTGGGEFFNAYFNTLAGTGKLREQISRGDSPAAIRESWKAGLHRFQQTRTKYLLYPDSDLCRAR